MASERVRSVGIVGARGYAGAELIALIAQHPGLRLAFAASRSQAGEPVPGVHGARFIDADPDAVARQGADAVVLAVPDGATGPYLAAMAGAVVVDLSADHRFEDGWAYGLPEHFGEALRGATRIANPGCYATAVQLAARPLLGLLDGAVHAFGVSGYSGAGTTPSPRNDPVLLSDGVTPYRIVGHTHEREASRHLGTTVRFSPHVAPYFRGITVTVQARLRGATSVEELTDLYRGAYAGCGLVSVLGERMPRVQEIAGRPDTEIGGLSVGGDGRDVAVVCTLDNLLKGAASQAVQNLNLAFGLESEFGLAAGARAAVGAS